MESWFDSVEAITVRYLAWRKKRHLAHKKKQAKKNVIVDWIEAFLWAAVVVLLINQYLFQAYQIPSGSMIDTLLIQDRIFVNKMIYGPELVPGALKLPGPVVPLRNEVVIFENPSYLSKGPVFDILQRIIYMITFSMVDIDSDDAGEPRAHFLIKRAVGMERDRIVLDRGVFYLQPEGMPELMKESDFFALSGFPDSTRRTMNTADYPGIEANAMADAYATLGLPAPRSLGRRMVSAPESTTDMYQWMKLRQKTLYQAYPTEKRYGDSWRRLETGWYLPDGWLFTLGDNRDNSRDSRYYGPVSMNRVLGRAMFKYWPPGRIGAIR